VAVSICVISSYFSSFFFIVICPPSRVLNIPTSVAFVVGSPCCFFNVWIILRPFPRPFFYFFFVRKVVFPSFPFVLLRVTIPDPSVKNVVPYFFCFFPIVCVSAILALRHFTALVSFAVMKIVKRFFYFAARA